MRPAGRRAEAGDLWAPAQHAAGLGYAGQPGVVAVRRVRSPLAVIDDPFERVQLDVSRLADPALVSRVRVLTRPRERLADASHPAQIRSEYPNEPIELISLEKPAGTTPAAAATTAASGAAGPAPVALASS